ncbi:MAG TPA: SOS response-associated peptidase [Acidimicrobiales bacterium]|jgi:putative SOS response-associated peptidase YedK|nr:SOS response-associated peptidase [Acidimicrobiales bacterium]
MCGRFVVASPPLLLAEHFTVDEVRLDVDGDGAPAPNYNVAPTDRVIAVATHGGRRLLGAFQWGLVPSWAPDAGGGARLINARAETVTEKRAFRDAFARRRCIVAADGFYEWRLTAGGLKQPVFISAASGAPLAFAGLWEVWRDRRLGQDAPPLRTCTIVTTTANSTLSPLHSRMPVVLPRSTWATWLDPAVTDTGELSSLLVPLDDAGDGALVLRDVSRAVNDVRNNGPQLLDPVA